MTRMPPLPSLHMCLFLDVDGTLVELTDTPSQTVADSQIIELLMNVEERLNGALALVSGRAIKTLDLLFAPLTLPAAGLHGVERRRADGDLLGASFPDARLNRARADLTALAQHHPGILIEDKGRTVAVHYRLAPRDESAAHAAVTDIVEALGGNYQIQAGNMLFEIKPRGFSKATAVTAFMHEPPFAGRQPVFIGDDLTDQDGFRKVEELGGISIGVGDRVHAQYHLEGVTAVRGWLRRLMDLREPRA